MNFPHQPEYLTAAWLTDTLRQAGVLDRASVRSFEFKPRADAIGLTSQNTIIGLTYDIYEENAPQSLFVKFAFSNSEQRAQMQVAYAQEILFYQQFAQRVRLLTPRAYFSAFDEASGHFLLLLEDCSYGVVADRMKSVPLERSKLIITEIARLHAAWWEHSELTQHSWIWTQESVLQLIQTMYSQAANRLYDLPEIQREPELVQTMEEYSRHFVDVTKYLQKPYTVIHGDYHLGNMIFIETNGTPEVMVIDWQAMSIGRGATDVACFLTVNLSIEDRRRQEEDLVKLYHDTLCEYGVANYTFDQFWDDYRLGVLERLWRKVLVHASRVARGTATTAEPDQVYTAVVDLKPREILSRVVT